MVPDERSAGNLQTTMVVLKRLYQVGTIVINSEEAIYGFARGLYLFSYVPHPISTKSIF